MKHFYKEKEIYIVYTDNRKRAQWVMMAIYIRYCYPGRYFVGQQRESFHSFRSFRIRFHVSARATKCRCKSRDAVSCKSRRLNGSVEIWFSYSAFCWSSLSLIAIVPCDHRYFRLYTSILPIVINILHFRQAYFALSTFFYLEFRMFRVEWPLCMFYKAWREFYFSFL